MSSRTEVMNGAKHQGEFYYIEVRPKEEYKAFRTRAENEKNGIERVAGQRADGTWDTVKWLVSTALAHIENGRLVADHADAQELLDKLDAEPQHLEGNRFVAQDRTAG